MVKEFEQSKLKFYDKDFVISIAYDQFEIGTISIDGQVKLADHFSKNNRNYIRLIRQLANEYFQSYVDKRLVDANEKTMNNYEVDKLYRDDKHGIYYMMNKKDYNRILAYITQKPEAVIVDQQLPIPYLKRFFKAYCFSNKITGDSIVDVSAYTNQQLNVILCAYIKKLDPTFIRQYLKPELSWQKLYILTLAKELEFADLELDYLNQLACSQKKEELMYCVFRALISLAPLTFIEKLLQRYQDNFVCELLYALSEELRYFELENILQDCPEDQDEFIKRKNVYLNRMDHLQKNTEIFQVEVDPLLEYPIYLQLQKQDQQQEQNHSIFKNLFSKKSAVQEHQLYKLDVSRLRFNKQEMDIQIEYNKEIIGKILKDKRYILDQKDRFNEDDLMKIEELIYAYIVENPKYFIEKNEIFYFKENDHLIFYRKENEKKEIVAKLFSDGKLELYSENLVNLEKSFIFEKWLFSSEYPIFKKDKLNTNQQQVIIKSFVKGLKLKDTLILANASYPSEKMEHILFTMIEKDDPKELDNLIKTIQQELGILNNQSNNGKQLYLDSYQEEILQFAHEMETIKTDAAVSQTHNQTLFELIKNFIKDDADLDRVKEIIESRQGK